MVFVQKWPFFLNFFLGSIGRENVFFDIREQKTFFLAIKEEVQKVAKLTFFLRG